MQSLHGEHPASGQIAEILVYSSEAGYTYCSGYRIAPSLILSARHLVSERSESTEIEVRLGGRSNPPETHSAVVAWLPEDQSTDLALLRIHNPRTVPSGFYTPQLGRLNSARARNVPFVATGFPAFGQIQQSSGTVLRDSYQVSGEISTQTNIKTGLLELTRGGRILTLGPNWKGISGAAVFVHDYLVGIISEVDANDGSLQATPIWHAIGPLDGELQERVVAKSDAHAFMKLLTEHGISPKTWPARRRTAAGERVLAIAARTSDLLDRRQELEQLVEFCRSQDAYQWWIGAPWAGKTALAAHLATFPPDGVDVVAFFISRSEGIQTRQFSLCHLRSIGGAPR